MRTPRNIDVQDAKYVCGHKLRLRFNDGTEQQMDFGPFLKKAQHPSLKKYKRIDGFRRFRIEGGNIMWGDYDMIFPVADLYPGEIS
ncbi:MAG TPA: DUF2442 domain-containing protein [Verrucomicrobiae bacterium]|nr:DUF2442 domain-containing protein [Verrucomicrobiae bacterium]